MLGFKTSGEVILPLPIALKPATISALISLVNAATPEVIVFESGFACTNSIALSMAEIAFLLFISLVASSPCVLTTVDSKSLNGPDIPISILPTIGRFLIVPSSAS